MLMMPGDDVLSEPVVRRVEVFTGAGRRRRWSAEARAQIVAESYATSVGEMADRYGLAKTNCSLGGGMREAQAATPGRLSRSLPLWCWSLRPRRCRSNEGRPPACADRTPGLRWSLHKVGRSERGPRSHSRSAPA